MDKKLNTYETLKLKQTYEDIIRQMVEVARTYSNYGNTNFRIIHSHISFQPENIESVSELFAQSLISNDEVRGEYAIHNIDIDDFLINGFPFFKDAQSKTTTNHFREYILNKVNWKNNNTIEYKINYIKSWGYEPDSLITNEEISDIIVGGDGQFPLSYKKGKSEAAIIKNRGALRNIVATAYPELSVQVKDWIYPPSENNELPPLLLVPMYGYKPSGDSRPDRGLLPMLKSMFPSLARKNRVLVIMYSIHTPENWRDLLRQGNNELWNVIAELAGALIVDVTRDGILFDGGEV